MDKYEYNLKLDEIKNLYKDCKYEAAAKVADGINWNKVKNVNILVKVGDVYEKLGRLEDAREILILAYNRSPLGRNIIYKLAKLALKLNDIESANEYYDEFVEIGPNDAMKFALKYEIKKATGATTEELIPILESLKEHEYTEEWAYELAYLYHKADMVQKCVSACDELILWFGDGPYVERALELKILYHPLTKKQEEKYKKFHLDDKKIQKIEKLVEENEISETLEKKASKENEEKYDTDSLKKSLEGFIKEIKDAKNREEIDSKLNKVKELVVDIPYLKVIQVDDEVLKETKNIETDEEIDGSLKMNFKELLSEGTKGQINITKSENDGKEAEQLSIDDILGEWEKTKRAAETALKKAEEKKLNASKARALAVAEDILKRLNEVIPKLKEGYSPKELLEREYLKDKYDLVEAAREHNLGIELDPDKIKEKEKAKEQNEIKSAIEAERAVADIYNSDADVFSVKSEKVQNNLNLANKVEDYDKEDDSQNDDSVVVNNQDTVVETKKVSESRSENKKTTEDVENTANVDTKDDQEKIVDSKDDSTKHAIEKVEKSSELKDNAAKADESKQIKQSVEDDVETDDKTEKGKDNENSVTENVEVDSEDTVENIGEEAWNGLCNIFNNVFKSTEKDETEEEDPVEQLLDKNDEIADKTGVLVDFDEVKTDKSDNKNDNKDVKNQSAESDKLTEDTKPMPTREELEEEIKKQLSEKKAERSRQIKKNGEVVKELTSAQKSIFSYFVPIKGMEKQLCQVLTGLKERLEDKTNANTKNLIVQGTRGCGKTVLATGIIKVLQEETGKPEGRVGKIQASALNKKDINKLIKKVSGGCLIIENVCELTKKTAVALSLLMEHDTSGMLIIFEDTPNGIEKAFSLDAGLEKKFSEKITVPIFNNDELVAFGKAYCSELGYAIDEMAILALYNRINNIQRLDQATTISEVKDIIDEAIMNERKKGRIKAFSRFNNKKRYTEDNRIILREKDFE